MKVIIKNSDLVFQRKHTPVVVYKNYWIRGEGQYIDLTNVNNVKDLLFNNIKIEAEFYIGKTTFSAENGIICSRSNNCRLYTMNGSGYNRLMWSNVAYTGSSASLLNPSVGEYSIVANNKTGTLIINNDEPKTFTSPGESRLSVLWMFAHGSGSTPTADSYDQGASKVKRLKVYNATTDELILDIRPALVDEIPALYESVTGTALYSEDETPLVVE